MYYYLIVLCFVHYHIDTTLEAVEHNAIYVTTSVIFHLHIASLHRYLKISQDIHSSTIIVYSAFSACAFSALTLLVGQQEGHPVSKKQEWWGAGVVICVERGADLHMAQLMPLPLTVSCFSKIQIGFAFLVPAHPGSPGQRAVKRVCVCVYHSLQALGNTLSVETGQNLSYKNTKTKISRVRV